MKKGIFLSYLTITIFLCNTGVLAIAEMKNLNFKQNGNISLLELIFDQASVSANKFHVSEDKQIIIDLKNVSTSERVMRAFDTSEFSGAVVFVSAYKKPGTKNDIRIALQLRDNVRSILKKRENKLILEIENRFGVFNQRQVLDSKKTKEIFKKVTNGELEPESGRFHSPKSSSVEDILENLTLSGRKKYIGKRISLDVKNLAVEDILKMISEASGFNIILTSEVKKLPLLTLNLTNVPWDQALDTILGLNKLVAKKNGIILMIQSLKTATKDRQDEAKAKSLALKQEPLVTKVFPISYALTKDLTKILKEYLTKERGSIAQDERTNSIIIKDTPDVIDKMKKIIGVLDLQTPQVLIQSKIVEVNESYSKEIGLSDGLNFGYDPIGEIGQSSPSPVGSSLIDGSDGGPGFSISTAPAANSSTVRSALGLKISRFSRLTGLDFTLQLMESESKGKVLSSPKVVTQNKKKATLSSQKTNSYKKVTGTGDSQEVSFEETTASLNLAVTPQITNEGSIILEISLSKEDFGARSFPDAPPNKFGNTVETNVLVENGSTIVIGGLYEYSKLESHSGIPFLKDIPLVGWLFRTAYNPATTKREVIIFLTPRIINQEEAGLVQRG